MTCRRCNGELEVPYLGHIGQGGVHGPCPACRPIAAKMMMETLARRTLPAAFRNSPKP